MGLRPVREHAITHMDARSLSSLKERGTLDISRARVFPIKGPLWKTLMLSLHSFAHFSQERVLLSYRECS